MRWDNENILQQPPCSTESKQKSHHQTHESKNASNQGQKTIINDPDVPLTVIEDPPHLDQKNIVQFEPNPNLDANLNPNVDPHPNLDATQNLDSSVNGPLDINIREIESVGEIPIEAIPFKDPQFIAVMISHSETVEDIKCLRDESGLTTEQLQLGWNLLPSSEKERLRPLFAQLSQPEPDTFPIGPKIQARLQHLTGQWMGLIGDVVEFLTDSGDIHKQLRTADGGEYPLRCLEDIQPLSWEERMGLS